MYLVLGSCVLCFIELNTKRNINGSVREGKYFSALPLVIRDPENHPFRHLRHTIYLFS
jgi:hypothetical protein